MIKTLADLNEVRQKGLASLYPKKTKICVSTATCGLATGAGALLEAISEETRKQNAEIIISRSGCIGFCQMEPIVLVYTPGEPTVIYKEMTPEKG
ncbi:ferredoxin, partial [Planctomycetota bacterium]